MVGRFGTALLKPANADQEATPSIGEIGLNHFAPYLINRISARWSIGTCRCCVARRRALNRQVRPWTR